MSGYVNCNPMLLLNPDRLAGNPLHPDKRRRWFDFPANADTIILNKDDLYTMNIITHPMLLLHLEFLAGNPLCPDKRRRWFDVPVNADSVILSKEYVYTLHSWQHWCNIATYRLQLNSVLSFDLCQFSEGQPLQIMAKDQAVSWGGAAA
eukprot:GHUV01041521.1.p1 GENE.GHUV01041521.1~~GHUV01041521.1.p1  ORF type:complete len:149 (-),score=29.28 GHUV01041521.1:270-716(-)